MTLTETIAFHGLATLDSAELRFDRIPLLSAMKRRMLVATNQIGKAVDEARAMVEAAPTRCCSTTSCWPTYGVDGKDSLAPRRCRSTHERSGAVDRVMPGADRSTPRQDYRSLLAVTRSSFSDVVPLETKIKRFEQFTRHTLLPRILFPTQRLG